MRATCTCWYECEGRIDDTCCPSHDRRAAPPTTTIPWVEGVDGRLVLHWPDDCQYTTITREALQALVDRANGDAA